MVPTLAGPAQLVPLASLASRGTSVIALRTAAQRGRLKAQRGDDGQWRSTRAWVTEYQRSRYERKPR
ncbi:hypothetical protein CSO01_21060 [Cellulomonas soli]|uniref:Uncharacterized protein n=1 Tax=Cellulomonas soli TaxID=931535 RepID=A0A512PDV2_9CELL|nr:hypothetical protein CSO01_21060 [Cellulomonas soli]